MNLGEEERATAEVEVRFSKTSRFGLFVRNCCAEFEAAQFDQVSELWRAFVVYRKETEEHLRKKVTALDGYSFDSVLLSGQQEDWGLEGVQTLERVVYEDLGGQQKPLPASRDDIEKLLEFQVEKMQSIFTPIPFYEPFSAPAILTPHLRVQHPHPPTNPSKPSPPPPLNAQPPFPQSLRLIPRCLARRLPPHRH
jgi:hypothetical protein